MGVIISRVLHELWWYLNGLSAASGQWRGLQLPLPSESEKGTVSHGQCDSILSMVWRGARLLDVGAGTCPCKSGIQSMGAEYVAHDFQGYSGKGVGSVFQLGYGNIDVVSDITSIP